MNYTIRQLQVFTRVCEQKSITKASELLHMTQPAASVQLRNFQDQFEIPLTEVIGRQLYVTPFGQEIYLACMEILEGMKRMEQTSMSYNGHIVGKLTISIVSTGKYIMPHFLAQFLKLNPGVELSMDVTNKASVIRSLEQNSVDFSLVSILPDGLVVEKIELMKNALVLVGDAASIIVTEPMEPNQLSELPMILREKGSGTRQTMERFLERHQIEPKKKLELTSNEAVKQAVIAGLGYSIMPVIGIQNELVKGDLRIIPVNGLPLHSSWNMIWLKNKKFLPPAAAFVNYLKLNKDEIIRDRFRWYEDY